jgi:glycosyltransferase involved in cell wall biosynthesis
MSPRFSVVIPTYNQADFLRVAIQSVLDQTSPDFEIIIVNNHSSDHTLDVVAQSGDSRIKVINFKNHGVIGAARNVGIKASTGEYVAFLDSDDSWYHNKLERVATAIDSDPSLGLVCHDQDLFREGHPAGRAHYGFPEGFNHNLYEYMLLKGNCVSTSAAVVGRTYLEQVGCFSEDHSVITAEDYDLWLRLSQVCTFGFIEESLGAHYYHQGGASANVEVHLGATLAVLDRHFENFQSSNRFKLKRAMLWQYASAYYGAARQYHRRGALIKPVGYYFRSLKTYPLYLRAYAGLMLLSVDILLGQGKRRQVIRVLWPRGRSAGWLIS